MSRAAVKIFSCPRCSGLVSKIESRLGLSRTRVDVSRLPNGDTRAEILESVRGHVVYVFQTASSGEENDALMEMLQLIRSAKLSLASKVVAVMPNHFYSRQDKAEGQRRVPIAARLVADLVQAAGADQVITMDLHSPQMEGFYNVPVEHLSPTEIMVKWVQERRSPLREEMVVVSPNVGSRKRATKMAEMLNCNIVFVQRFESAVGQGQEQRLVVLGFVKDKAAVVVDDLVEWKTLE